ncbi:hypothetical protein U1Q18_010684 [Sarracenia purpurea var. burkii]
MGRRYGNNEPQPIFYPQYIPASHFSSHLSDNEEDEDEGDEQSRDDDEEGCDDVDDDEGVSASNCGAKREYTLEEKEKETAEIGYKVMGPLDRSERVFKAYEPVFALVQVPFSVLCIVCFEFEE